MNGSEAERLFAGDIPDPDDPSDEIAEDAVQLLMIANFNGLCRLIAAVARNGLLSPEQLENIHGAMTLPLDDPDWRDYAFIAETRDEIERMLARAIRDTTVVWKDSE